MTADLVPIERPTTGTALDEWSDGQIALIKQAVAPGCSDEFLAYFAQVCQHRGLDPFAGEICGVPRRQKVKGAGRRDEWETVHVIQVTVDGLRAIAERSGLYGGQDQPEWCGPDGVWRDVWLEEGPPAAARVAVYRLDWPRPVVGVARYASYVQLGKDDQGKTYPKALWGSGPDFMLAKCAEAQALKRAFPRQMAAAGVPTRGELSLAQRISMEARAAGIDDDGRHALVAEVTRGRTESTREVNDDEALELRRRIAEGPPPGVDEDGEIIDAELLADEWTADDLLAAVRPSLDWLDDEPNHQHRVTFRKELTRQRLSWRRTDWSLEDLKRVAGILQELDLWIDPKPLPESKGDRPVEEYSDEPF